MVFHMILKKTSQGAGENVFVINNLSSLAIDLSSPLTPMPLPEEGAEENILVKMEGNTQTIPFSWTTMKEDNVVGTDFTYGGGVWSLQNPRGMDALDQIKFWEGFAPDSVGDKFSFFIYEDGVSEARYFNEGSITKIRHSISGSSPVVWNTNLDFIVGSVIAAFESNSPERPTITDVSSPTSGDLKVDWKPFDGYATGEAPTLTNHVIKYKPVDGSWITILPSPAQALATADNYTIPSLAAGQYIVKVASENIESAGSLQRNYSYKELVTVT